MKKPLIALVSLLLTISGAWAQVVTTISAITLCAGATTVDIPVKVSSFSAVGSISLKLSYSEAELSSPTALYIDAGLDAWGTFLINTDTPGVIIISAYDPDIIPPVFGLTLSDNTTLFILRFTIGTITKPAALTFIENGQGTSCEYGGVGPNYTPFIDTPEENYYIPGGVTVNLRQSIRGFFKYYNEEGDILLTGQDITVNVYLTGDLTHSTSLGTDVTDGSGYYEIANLCPDCDYDIVAVSTHSTAGAINVTDAALANFWGPNPYAIEKVRFHAADVAGPDLFIGGTDAGRIQFNFVNGTAFDRSPWTFWKAGYTILHNPHINEPEYTEYYPSVNLPAGNDIDVDMYGLVTGDFNRSYDPTPGKASSSSLDLIYAGHIQSGINQEIELPLKMVNASSVGAISLVLNFPGELMEVQDVLIDGAGGQLDWSVKGGNELRIGWFSQNQIILGNNDELLKLKLKTRETFTPGNSINISLAPDPLNELADGMYNVIGNAVLGIDLIEASTQGTQDISATPYALCLSAYPNPFTKITNIRYTLPFGGHVNLEIDNMLGKKEVGLVDETQPAGNYMIKFDAFNMPPGVYFAKLRLNSANDELIRTIKLINNK
jgi:hypothetical protein